MVTQMGVRSAMLGLVAIVAAATVLVIRSDRGEPEHAPGTYKGRWSPAYGRPLGGNTRRLRRDGRSLDILVTDGTCYPQAPASETDPRRRLRRVRVRETRHRVMIAVVMRSEKVPEGGVCAGIGRGFRYRVHLPHPVGRRAVIADHTFDFPETPIVYPAQDREVQVRLLRGYLAPAARTACGATPKDALAMTYGTRARDDRGVARAVAGGVPRSVRTVVYRACLTALRTSQ